MKRFHITRIAAPALLAALLATGAEAATFGELSGGAAPQGAIPGPMAGVPAGYAGPYAGAPVYCPPNCLPAAGNGFAMPGRGGPEGMPPLDPGALSESPYIPPYAANPRGYLPMGGYADGPASPQLLGSFGQLNSITDPFDPYGLSTPYMYVPWSTPMAGWTNAQTWNWWRERSGALPRNW